LKKHPIKNKNDEEKLKDIVSKILKVISHLDELFESIKIDLFNA
jgi:hypothetical protein